MCLCVPLSLLQAETRAEFAEKTVSKLEKTIDDLEGKKDIPPRSYSLQSDNTCSRIIIGIIYLIQVHNYPAANQLRPIKCIYKNVH